MEDGNRSPAHCLCQVGAQWRPFFNKRWRGLGGGWRAPAHQAGIQATTTHIPHPTPHTLQPTPQAYPTYREEGGFWLVFIHPKNHQRAGTARAEKAAPCCWAHAHAFCVSWTSNALSEHRWAWLPLRPTHDLQPKGQTSANTHTDPGGLETTQAPLSWASAQPPNFGGGGGG